MKKKLLTIVICWFVSLLLIFFGHDEWLAIFFSISCFCFGLYAVVELWQDNKQVENWQDLANRDDLTGLLNRRGFLATRILTSHSLLMLDIDSFKVINDQYGHATGDAVLKELAQHLQQNTRRGDICARWGGDEFIVILINTDIDTAQAFIHRLHQRLSSNNNLPQFSVSIGCADSTATQDRQTLIDLADARLLKNKLNRQNQLTK